jgi:hypothetical protein
MIDVTSEGKPGCEDKIVKVSVSIMCMVESEVPANRIELLGAKQREVTSWPSDLNLSILNLCRSNKINNSRVVKIS